MNDPIPAILGAVKWKDEPAPSAEGDLPYVTHSGVLNLFGHELRCFRLSDGKAVFHADGFPEVYERMVLMTPDPPTSFTTSSEMIATPYPASDLELTITKAQLAKAEELYTILAIKYRLLQIEHEALVERCYPTRVIDSPEP